MASTEAYMLQRDGQESKRLNAQHVWMRALSGGHLIHPSIPRKSLCTVADIATGTGVWLQDVATCAEFSRQAKDEKSAFVGFDISPQQFPPTGELPPNVRFVVHDMTEPFPPEYHEKFDLVNVRLVSYVIKAVDLQKVVQHILQLLRPGGFLQWQENDACDSWTTPETPMTSTMINYVISEKVARGLLPGIATPLLKTIQSYSTPIRDGQLNVISRSSETMRITQLETVSTRTHSSPAVAAGKKPAIFSAAVVLLQESALRRKRIVADVSTPSCESEKLLIEIEEIEKLIEAIKCGEDQACNNWEIELTWIIARKALLVNNGDGWMSAKHPA